MKNVVIYVGEEYIILSVIFLFYFIKKLDEVVKIYILLDIKIFLNYIVLVLEINRRYVGEEFLCEVIKIYNDIMKEILFSYNVEVIEVLRICIGNEIISVLRVRKLIKENKFLEVKKLIFELIYEFLILLEVKVIINKI